MKKLILLVSALLLTVSTGAFAAGRPYLGGSAGLFFPSDSTITDDFGASAEVSFDTGLLISGFGGLAFDNGFRLEGELSYRAADLDELREPGFPDTRVNSEISATSMMASAYYDMKTLTTVTPYVGGGIGLSNVNLERGTFDGGGWRSDDETVFAFQVGAGVGIAVNPRVAIDLGYRYFATEDVRFDQFDAELESHNVAVGMRYMF